MDKRLRLFMVGLNHRTAPVEVRENLAIPRERQQEFLQHLVSREEISEALLISTCNRVELYSILACDLAPTEATRIVRRAITHFQRIASERFKNYLYSKEDLDALEHLFRVSASLDSMVLGESQILGQVKEAYTLALEAGTIGHKLERCLNQALKVAKKIRTNTEIGKHAISVGHVAVQLAKRIFTDLSQSIVLLMGAGEMGELCAQNLYGAGARDVFVLNRKYERAQRVAESYGWQPRSFGDLPFLLEHVDIIIVSTGASSHVLLARDVKAAMKRRRYRPLFIVDIAVPRNADPSIDYISNAYLYDIDDLEEISASGIKERKRAAEEAETMVHQELVTFERWLVTQTVAPLISTVTAKAEEIRQHELDRAMKQLADLSDKQKKAVEALAHSIVKKILHDPIVALRQTAQNDEGLELLEAASLLFNINGNNKPIKSPSSEDEDAQEGEEETVQS